MDGILTKLHSIHVASYFTTQVVLGDIFIPKPGINCGIYRNEQQQPNRNAWEDLQFARVLNGEDADLSDHPWQVYQLGIDKTAVTDDGHSFEDARRLGLPVVTCSCGGTIVSPHWVLSAAHCMYSCVEGRSHVRLGSVEIHTELKGSKLNSAYNGDSKFVETSRIFVHPGFGNLKTGKEMIHDIALLHSDRSLTGSMSKQSSDPLPACLPGPAFCAHDGDMVTVSGWGRTSFHYTGNADMLQEAKLFLVNHKHCENKFAFPHVQSITDDMICAKGANGEDSCQGDSGGPLIFNNQNSAVLYGVVSWGVRCGGDHPGVYTRVSKYVEWIEATTRVKNPIKVPRNPRSGKSMCGEPYRPSTEPQPKCGYVGFTQSTETVTNIEDYPWYYLVQACKSRACVTRPCPATLVSKQFLLTAASCVAWSGGDIAEGVLISREISRELLDKYGGNLMALPVSQFDVSREIYVHPGHNLRTGRGNLALIKLDNRLAPTKNVPICLPSSAGFCLNSQYATSLVESITFDIHEPWKFKSISIDIHSKSNCNKWYGMKFPADVVCAAGLGGRDTCMRDRGVGMWYGYEEQKYLYGVTNVGSADCSGRVPRMYTRITSYLDWIYQTTNSSVGSRDNGPLCLDNYQLMPEKAKQTSRSSKKMNHDQAKLQQLLNLGRMVSNGQLHPGMVSLGKIDGDSRHSQGTTTAKPVTTTLPPTKKPTTTTTEAPKTSTRREPRVVYVRPKRKRPRKGGRSPGKKKNRKYGRRRG